MKFSLLLIFIAASSGCMPDRPKLASVTLEDSQKTHLLFQDISVFDGEELRQHQDVLVKNELIAAIGKTGSLQLPNSFSEVSGEGRTLLPGLIDSHAHLFSAGEKTGLPPEAQAISRAFLYAGVTTILVAAGGPEYPALLELKASDEVLTPHLFFGGPGLTAPGGHPIPLLESMLPWPMNYIMRLGVATAGDGEEAEQETRNAIADGSLSLFKIIYDDLPPGSPHLSKEALVTAIKTAIELGVRPIVHASAPGDAVEAVQAGAQLLMHIPQKEVLTDDQVQKLFDSGVPVVTTVRLISAARELSASGSITIEAESVDSGVLQSWIARPSWDLEGFSEDIDQTNEIIAGYTETNFQKLLNAGVTLFVGTDSGVHGVFPGSSMHRETRKLVDLGMQPIDALRAATSIPADFLDPDRSFGRIAPGQRADILIVKGDPLSDITSLENIDQVYLTGKLLVRNRVDGGSIPE